MLKSEADTAEAAPKPGTATAPDGGAGTTTAGDWEKGLYAYNNGNYATALSEWKPLAERGNARAQINLGFMYANGQGVSRNNAEAARLYSLAAEQGSARAQQRLDAMLKSQAAESEAAASTGPPLTSGKKDALRVSVEKCWNVGSLSTDALGVTVVVGVTFRIDGRPEASSINLVSAEGGDDDAAHEAYEAARRAIIRCGANGYDLPAEKYNEWRNMEFVFNPEKIMRIDSDELEDVRQEQDDPDSPTSEVIVKQFEGGGVYEGTFRNARQHGQGVYRTPDGYEYSGEWADGVIAGEGTARFADGSVYEGTFVDGKPEGEGRFTFADGGTYEGNWSDGLINGDGTLIYATGVRYTGQFKEGEPHGQGRLEAPSGYIYQGTWVDGLRDGTGTITYPDGATYEGAMKAGKREGEGTLTTAEGVTFTGLWSDGQIEGEGRLVQANGDVFEGTFVAGKRQGKGRVVYANSDTYEGDFQDDFRHGKGVLTGSDGFRYDGDWIEGQIEGQGRMTYPDGSVYEGQFRADQPEGNGRIVYPNGDVCYSKRQNALQQHVAR